MDQWDTTSEMTILQYIICLKSQIINLKNTFAQADIPIGEPLFIELPSYFKSDEGQHVVFIRLKKTLYGQTKASCLWYENLRNGLLCRRFVVNKLDRCLFMSKTVICVVYVYDCLFGVSSQSEIVNVPKRYNHPRIPHKSQS